ncbi:hypothetical protein [Mycobacterium spongiae]|uniref:Acyl-CoA dehydrogenase C-terminal domain-containing protein n=1 Tax=Mycobacterium spongiae TaxID=886343 RepID=A0A975JXX4_9MYCO|nr:hypothetical protein [Mycobacterium spongiae]QUR67355.1 hypothetical protein F6B93_09835 [Mycobacterium spongiae]
MPATPPLIADAGSSSAPAAAASPTDRSAGTDPIAAARSLQPLIESETADESRNDSMTPAIVAAIDEARLFHLAVPADLGGAEAPVETILAATEALAFADGSVGWCYAQNITVMSFSAYLARNFADEVAGATAAAGMFAPIGKASLADPDFMVEGRYPFGSGSSYADHIGGAVFVEDAEANGLDPLEFLRGFLVPADRVELLGNWDVMGLRGTGSFDFHVPRQRVAAGQTFSLLAAKVITGGPFYQLGPIVLAGVPSTAWALGVAERALAEMALVAKAGRTRMGSIRLVEQPAFLEQWGSHATALAAARDAFAAATNGAIDAHARQLGTDEIATATALVKSTGSFVVDMAKRATTFAWEAAGSAAIRNPSRLQRCYRDMSVGSGHLVWDRRNYAEYAQSRLGIGA